MEKSRTNKKILTEEDEQSADETVETQKVTLYFSDNDLMETYRMEKGINVYKGDYLQKSALEAWIDGPDHRINRLSRFRLISNMLKKSLI